MGIFLGREPPPLWGAVGPGVGSGGSLIAQPIQRTAGTESPEYVLRRKRGF